MNTQTPPQTPKTGGTLLSSLPHDVVMRAKWLVSNLLLERGAIVLDMECGTGTLTAAMAALQPHMHFIGIDPNRQKIMRARGRFAAYDIPNLTFESGDITAPRRPDDSVDAIINARVLGEVFTRHQYDPAPLQSMLQTHMRMLKPDGIMLVYDYPMPPDDEFVQIEFPVPERSTRHFRLYGTPIGITQGEREIALLKWFSEHAAGHGFYLEELPPHVPYTRLFRLPSKWAYEFIIRKQNIRAFKSKIRHQYTAFTAPDLSRILTRDIGAQLIHSAPWHNQHIIRTHFEGSFRLYTSSGKPRGYPPTAQIFVAQKTQQKTPVQLSELRPANTQPNSLQITAMREDDTGTLTDIIIPHERTIDIIPYVITADGAVEVILQSAARKPLTNTIPRTAPSLDGKFWSGYMAQVLTLPADLLPLDQRDNPNTAAKILQKHFGLRPRPAATFIKGPAGFPAPALIDELRETLFINVERPDNSALRIATISDALKLRLYNATDVLRATACGLIPNAWLDIQMQDLLRKCGHKITPWLHEAIPLSYDPPPADQLLRAGKILRQKPPKPDANTPQEPLTINARRGVKTAGKFRPVRGRAGQVSAHRSAFVEHDNKGRPLTTSEHDFACPQSDMLNIAAILPLTEDHQGNTLVGFEFKELPIPSRFGQTEPMMNLPTLPLPATITTMEEARAYIADQFGVETSRVAQMGESFFTHIDLIPQRVFPFCLTRYPRRRTMKMRYTTLECLHDLIDPDFADSFLWYWGMAYARLCHDTQHTYSWAPRKEANERKFGTAKPKLSTADTWRAPKHNQG